VSKQVHVEHGSMTLWFRLNGIGIEQALWRRLQSCGSISIPGRTRLEAAHWTDTAACIFSSNRFTLSLRAGSPD
jgi:alanine-alpha-ketoisovalerate/valine-pyruvate aminotransferase